MMAELPENMHRVSQLEDMLILPQHPCVTLDLIPVDHRAELGSLIFQGYFRSSMYKRLGSSG